MQGTYRGNIKLMNVDVHIGKQDGKDHGELSFYEMGRWTMQMTRISGRTTPLRCAPPAWKTCPARGSTPTM